MKLSTQKIAKIGILSTLSLIFSYVEVMIPFIVTLPAVKLGLSNIVILYAIYTISIPAAFFIMVVRVLLSGFLFQGSFAIIYGLTGGTLSIVLMSVLKKLKQFSIISISMSGGCIHNIGQFIVAALVLDFKSVVAYLPILLISGFVAGLVIGIVADKTIKIINREIKK